MCTHMTRMRIAVRTYSGAAPDNNVRQTMCDDSRQRANDNDQRTTSDRYGGNKPVPAVLQFERRSSGIAACLLCVTGTKIRGTYSTSIIACWLYALRARFAIAASASTCARKLRPATSAPGLAHVPSPVADVGESWHSCSQSQCKFGV